MYGVIAAVALAVAVYFGSSRWRETAAAQMVPTASDSKGVSGLRSAQRRHTQDGQGEVEHLGQEFVELALALGKLRPNEVDAYFGPAALLSGSTHASPNTSTHPSPSASIHAPQLDELLTRAKRLAAELDVEAGAAGPDLPRVHGLQGQVRSLTGLLQLISAPRVLSFDAEARLVYGMGPVGIDTSGLKRKLQRLEALLPGAGSLAGRVANFQSQFVIPSERRKVVFERALAECRARTMARWKLPSDERLEVEWDNGIDVPWHKYQGHHRSTLQLNPAAVAVVGSAIDVACHEAYPGHHTQFIVMETDAGPQGLAVEDTVVLLRSPVSMLREGAANYGVELALPAPERLAFERNILFPLAGLDPAQARKYDEIHRLVIELGANVIPIARSYRDKQLPSEIARVQLESSALVSSPDALLSYVDDVGPYILGYTAACDNVRAYVEAHSGGSEEGRWAALRKVLAQADVAALMR